MCDCVSLAFRARRYKRLLVEKRREFLSVTERGLWAGSALTLMNARAVGPAGNVGRRTIRMNAPIQPELFAQNAGRKKRQQTRLYLKKRNEHRLGAGRADPRKLPMAYIIAEPGIGTKDTACVDVCPVDCIHPAKGRTYDDGRLAFDEVPQLYVDPTEYIDCGACVPVCPVTAIFVMDDLPEKWHAYIEINKNYVDDGKFQPDKYQKPGS
jgi:ferredoxin